MVSETKIDESEILIKGFSTPHRLGQTTKGGEILLYIRHA